ncbi:MAG: hypothetical protein ABJC04_03040 [Verrucomicrobiota bacterium]
MSKMQGELFSSRLQLERKFFRLRQFAKSSLASFLVSSFLFSLLLSASPGLHQFWHEGAAQASHQCSITFFQQQHILAADTGAIIVQQSPGLIFRHAPDVSAFLPESDYRFSSSRAPPVSLSSLV